MRGITPTAIDYAWNNMMVKDRVWIVVVGDVEWKDVHDKVQKAFGEMRSNSQNASAYRYSNPFESLNGTDVDVLDYPDAPTWHIAIDILGPLATDPEYNALAVGFGVLDDRLYKTVREEFGLAYTVGASLYGYRQTMGKIWLTTDKPADALPAVSNVVRELLTSAPKADEIEAIYRGISTGMLFANRTSTDLADLLGGWQIITGDRMNADAFLRDTATVTPEEVQSALKSYLKNAAVVAAGPIDGIDQTQLSDILPEP
jgi:zinc protease